MHSVCTKFGSPALTFVVLDLFSHERQVERNVVFMTAHDSEEVELELVQDLSSNKCVSDYSHKSSSESNSSESKH